MLQRQCMLVSPYDCSQLPRALRTIQQQMHYNTIGQLTSNAWSSDERLHRLFRKS